MKLHTGIVSTAAVVLTVTLGCGRQERDRPTSVASELMVRLIMADTLRQYSLVAGDANWSECEWVWSSDITRPIAAVRIIDQSQADSVVQTRVEYTVLGSAFSGALGAGFERGIAVDTITVAVSVGAHGRGRFQCGDYSLNHPGLTKFTRDWVPYLDSASKEEWAAAVAALRQ